MITSLQIDPGNDAAQFADQRKVTPAAPAKPLGMKRDLAEILLFNSVGSVRSDRECCSGCHRTPLAGELMQRLADDRVMCPLCFTRVPARKRADARAERVHVGAVRLAVVPRAAAA
jgi:hypothetical protein